MFPPLSATPILRRIRTPIDSLDSAAPPGMWAWCVRARPTPLDPAPHPWRNAPHPPRPLRQRAGARGTSSWWPSLPGILEGSGGSSIWSLRRPARRIAGRQHPRPAPGRQYAVPVVSASLRRPAGQDPDRARPCRDIKRHLRSDDRLPDHLLGAHPGDPGSPLDRLVDMLDHRLAADTLAFDYLSFDRFPPSRMIWSRPE